MKSSINPPFLLTVLDEKPFKSPLNCEKALLMLVRCALADASSLETTTNLIDVSNPGLETLFSTASRVFAGTENFAFSGSDSCFFVDEIKLDPAFCQFFSAGETRIWIAAASPSPIFASAAVNEDKGSVGKSLKVLIG